jgi:cytochrome b561
LRIDRILRRAHADNARLSNKPQSLLLLGSFWSRPVIRRLSDRAMPRATTKESEMTLVSRYHPLLVVLHWIMAVLIIAALALGALVMAKIANTSPMKIEALRSHMIGGTTILVLTLVRLILRTRTGHPRPASAGHPLLDRLAWVSHRMFYVVVLGQAFSGLVLALQAGLPWIVFGGGTLPADFWVYPIRTVHYLLSRMLIALIALHIAGALYHTLLLRDGLLRRMFFGRRFIVTADAVPARNTPASEAGS